jgi:hypothetical protein
MQRTLRTQSDRIRWAWLLSIFAAFAIYPALTQNIGALAYDAGTAHVYRSAVYSDAVSSGFLYPRWVQFLHLGLGSPLFTFLPPLPYAGLDLLYRLGVPQPVGWRVMMGAGLLAACVGAYLLVKELTGRRWAGVIAGIAFLYAPYVLRNAFERGSPEAFSTFLYPWVLWGLLRLAKRPSGGRFLLASALWAGCIAAHVLAPLMLAPIAVLLAIILAWRYRTPSPLLALLVGGLLTSFIWAPMLAEQRWVHVERDFKQVYASPAANPLALDRLLAAPAVYDVLRDNNSTGDRVGLWHMLWLIIGVPATLYAWRRGRRDLALAIAIATAVGLVLFWLLTGASDPVWRLMAPALTRIQYRFRWMGIQALAIAVVAGVCVALIPGRWQSLVSLILAGVLIFSALPSLYVGLQHRYASFENTVSLEQVRDAEISSGGTAFTYFGEFTPRGRTLPLDQAFANRLGVMFDPSEQPLAEPVGGLEVGAARVGAASWDMMLQSDKDQAVTLHLLYYPRWRAYVDGQPVGLHAQPETDYAQFDVPAGIHQIALRYGTTAAETIGWTLSLLTLLGLLAIAVRSRSTQRNSTAIRTDVTLSAAKSPSGVMREDDEVPGSHSERVDSTTFVAERRQRGISRSYFMSGGLASQAPTRQAPSEESPGSTGRDSSTSPPWWLLIGLTAALGFKVFYVDGHTTWLRCVSTPAKVCGAQVSIEIPFAGGPSLRGYSVSQTRLSPGQIIRVSLVWRGEPDPTQGAAAVPVRRLASFVHIRNSQKDGPVNPRTGNEIWAQDEHETPGGLLTTEYLPGRLYLDEFRVRLPEDLPPDEYFLEVGLADLAAGEQLEPQADAVKPPLGILWRSILLPNVMVTGSAQ